MSYLPTNHRFLNKLDDGIKKGVSLFYLYGNGVKDYFLFDSYLGIREVQKSLFFYFYNIQKVDAFAVIKDKKVSFLDENGKYVSVATALSMKKTATGFGAKKKSIGDSNKKIDDEAQSQADTQNSSRFINDLNQIEKNLDKLKIAIYFDEFEWQSGLYGAEQDLELIKKILNWSKSKTSIIVLNIKEPDLLKEFGFELDEKSPNMIYLSNPSQKEISRAYRRYIYKNRKDIRLYRDFEYIVSAIQASKKNLRESIRVLKRVLNSLEKDATLTKELFEDSLHKKIEEKVGFDDVILDVQVKDKIVGAVETFVSDRKNALKGIIMYGPPGTGKTYIAKAIANEYNLNFMSPNLSDLKGEYVGQTSGKVKRIFEEARANSPTLIFLDEIDTIFQKRGGADTDSYVVDMVNQFLVEIDGATTGKQDIFIIGATNRLEVVDSAIRSRLSTEIPIYLPNKVNREFIFNSKFENFKLSKQSWKDEFLTKTEGMSGRDIDNFTKNIKSRISDETQITEDIFNIALSELENNFVEDFKRDMQNSIEIEKRVKTNFNDIVGYDSVKRVLREEANYILSSKSQKERMKKFNISQQRGNLLYGPPGNGKTTFAESLAGEFNFYFIKILSKNFTSYSSLETIKKLDIIFENTIKLSKMSNQKNGVVLFFDEVDTLIRRDMDHLVRGTLLNYLEDENGIRSNNSRVILIAATNYMTHLDEASIRSGRFDSKIEINNPSEIESIDILQELFEKDPVLDLSEISEEFYQNIFHKLCEKMNPNTISVANLKSIKDAIKRVSFNRMDSDYEKIVVEDYILDYI